jgi:hypothetical protein
MISAYLSVNIHYVYIIFGLYWCSNYINYNNSICVLHILLFHCQMNSYHEGVADDFFDFAGPSEDILEKKLQDVFITFAPSGEIDSPSLVNMLREGSLMTQQFTSGSVHIAFMKARQVARYTPRLVK